MDAYSSEIDVPAFDEYDPTPYGGGYDLAETYGKPLLPSTVICYPRSVPEPHSLSPDEFSYGSIVSPYGKEEFDSSEKPTSKNGLSRGYCEEEQQPYGGNGDWLNGTYSPYDGYLGDEIFSHGHNGYGNDHGSDLGRPLDLHQDDQQFGIHYEDEGKNPAYDYQHWSCYGYGKGDHGYDCSQQTNDLGFCESIFGYWPCLSEKHQRGYDECDSGEQSYVNQNNDITEYLFGGLYPYSERKDGGNSYENPNYSYEGLYLEYNQSKDQYHYNEPPWFQE